jgi:hypothetical protein
MGNGLVKYIILLQFVSFLCCCNPFFAAYICHFFLYKDIIDKETKIQLKNALK